MPSASGGRSLTAVVPPQPKSPPKYPDFCGRRRLQLEVQILSREVGFLEEELQSLDGLQSVSRCCKEVNEFVATHPDPLLPINKKRSNRCCIFKWLRKRLCVCVSWICCCCGGCPLLFDQLSCICACPRNCCRPRNLKCQQLSCCNPLTSCCHCFFFDFLCCKQCSSCGTCPKTSCCMPGCPKSSCCSCKPRCPKCCGATGSCCSMFCCSSSNITYPEMSCGCMWSCPECRGVCHCPKCSRPCCSSGCLC